MVSAVVKFSVIVSPRAKSRAVKQVLGFFKFYIKSPPVDGKANQELIDFFSELTKIPRSFISIEKGAGAKFKTLFLKTSLTEEEVVKRLSLFVN